MKHTASGILACGLAVAMLAGCGAEKSKNPTSPSIAGPIAGVNITAPKPLEPQGVPVKTTEQPVTLLIENASTNGERALSYVFEIATDGEFRQKVFNREGVEPGGNGRTSLRLPDALAPDRTYYWRARALDGANTGPYSAAASFTVYTPVDLGVPQPISPVGGVRTNSERPEFKTRNASRSGPVGAIAYTFQISENEPFTAIVAVVTVPEQATETKFRLAQELTYDKRYFWRVRAYDPNTTGAWSPTQTFLTPTAPEPPPPPDPPPPDPPPPGGWPTNGPDVVRWAESHYPDRLRGGVSLDVRKANMAYVRDRMIEAGICGGMDLAWNLKRGGPEISIDFLDYKKNGVWIGVDIGFDYDNTSVPLRLTWGEAGTDYVYPKTYQPRPGCQ